MSKEYSKPIVLRSDIQPWERQEPKETELMYSRFLVYRDLGPETDRLRQAVEVLNATGDSITYGSIKDYSSCFRWAARAAAWDRYIVQADRARMVKLRREAIDEQRKVARELRSRALQGLEMIPVEDMSPADVVRYADLAFKIEKSIYDEYSPSNSPVSEDSVDETSDISSWSPSERRRRLEQLSRELAKRAARAVDDDEVVV